MENLTLKDIFEIKDEDREKTYYGVLVTEEDAEEYAFEVPLNIKEIGFKFIPSDENFNFSEYEERLNEKRKNKIKKDDEEELDDEDIDNSDIAERLLDVLIMYENFETKVLLEIDFEDIEKVSPKNIIATLMNTSFLSLSILPPKEETKENKEKYIKYLKKYLEEYLSQANIETEILPISSYLQYLYVELLNGKPPENYEVSDTYLKQKFADVSSLEFSNEFKDELRKCIYDFYGDRETFEIISKGLLGAIIDQTVNELKVSVEHLNEIKGKNEKDQEFQVKNYLSDKFKEIAKKELEKLFNKAEKVKNNSNEAKKLEEEFKEFINDISVNVAFSLANDMFNLLDKDYVSKCFPEELINDLNNDFSDLIHEDFLLELKNKLSNINFEDDKSIETVKDFIRNRFTFIRNLTIIYLEDEMSKKLEEIK